MEHRAEAQHDRLLLCSRASRFFQQTNIHFVAHRSAPQSYWASHIGGAIIEAMGTR